MPEALRLLSKCEKSSDARLTARLSLHTGMKPTLPLDADAQPLAIASYAYSDTRLSGLLPFETLDGCATTLLGGAPTASAASLRGSADDAAQDSTLRPLFFDRDTERLLPSVHLLQQEQLCCFDLFFQLSLIPHAGYTCSHTCIPLIVSTSV